MIYSGLETKQDTWITWSIFDRRQHYVLKKGAVSSSSAAVSTSQTILKGGTRVAADETLAEVTALLKKSKLPDGFVVWIEKNWEDLKRNPKLATKKVDSNSSSQPSSSPATPSELKAIRERQGVIILRKIPVTKANQSPKKPFMRKPLLVNEPPMTG